MNTWENIIIHSFFEVFYKKKNPTISGAFHALICISQTYSGNAAPVGKITKSNTMNSAVLVG